MKKLILFVVTALFFSAFSDSLIYDDGISRREVLTPLTNELLVMDFTGRFSTIPRPGYGEAYVIFYDGLTLCYKKVPHPKENDPLGCFSSSSSSPKITHGHMEAWLKANGITGANLKEKTAELELQMRAWGFGNSTNNTTGVSR